jgi:hypothetical protein
MRSTTRRTPARRNRVGFSFCISFVFVAGILEVSYRPARGVQVVPWPHICVTTPCRRGCCNPLISTCVQGLMTNRMQQMRQMAK